MILRDGSGTITTGGTAQLLFAARPGRVSLIVQNDSTEDLRICFSRGATMGAGSLVLPSGEHRAFQHPACPVNSVSIIGATDAQAFTAFEG